MKEIEEIIDKLSLVDFRKFFTNEEWKNIRMRWFKVEENQREIRKKCVQTIQKHIDEQPCKPNLGCATTKELLEEIRARIEVDGKLMYRTVNGD